MGGMRVGEEEEKDRERGRGRGKRIKETMTCSLCRHGVCGTNRSMHAMIERVRERNRTIWKEGEKGCG